MGIILSPYLTNKKAGTRDGEYCAEGHRARVEPGECDGKARAPSRRKLYSVLPLKILRCWAGSLPSNHRRNPMELWLQSFYKLILSHYPITEEGFHFPYQGWTQIKIGAAAVPSPSLFLYRQLLLHTRKNSILFQICSPPSKPVTS